MKGLQQVYGSEKYLLGLNLQTNEIHVVFHNESGVIDQLQAAFQVEVINVLRDLQDDNKVVYNTQ